MKLNIELCCQIEFRQSTSVGHQYTAPKSWLIDIVLDVFFFSLPLREPQNHQRDTKISVKKSWILNLERNLLINLLKSSVTSKLICQVSASRLTQERLTESNFFHNWVFFLFCHHIISVGTNVISQESAHKVVLVIFPCRHPYIVLYKRNTLDAETPSIESRDTKSGYLSSQ